MKRRRKTPTPRTRTRERGAALMLALFTMVLLLMVASSATVIGTADLKATRNYRAASQAHFVAESAIMQALQTVNATGVTNFETGVADTWSSTFGTGARTFAPLPGFTYTVTATADATSPLTTGRFVATASGPEGTTKVMVANVVRTDVPGIAPGAIYLAADAATDASFNGNAFVINGNDKNPDGTAGSGDAVPGIATRNATNSSECIDSLSSQQADNVLGLGFSAGPPMVPSVTTCAWAPTIAQLNQIALDLLAMPGVVTNNDDSINGNATFGTTASPQITHFTESVEIKGNGNATGCGVMIVDGDLTIKGTLNFQGLIIVRGQTSVASETDVTGNATVYGSLWTNDLNLNVGGSCIIQYSTQALAYSKVTAPSYTWPSPPTPLQISSLADCSMVPSGTGGCP